MTCISRWLGVTILALGAVKASSCAILLKEGSNNMQAELKVIAKPVGDKLQITYEVANRAATELFLFNLLLARDVQGEPYHDPNLVLIDIESGTVHFKKETPQWPTGYVTFTLPAEAYITVVKGNSVFRETFEVPYPVKPWSPYVQDRQNKNKGRAKGLTFRVECMRPGPETTLLQEPFLSVGNFGPQDKTEYLTSDLIPLEFPIEY